MIFRATLLVASTIGILTGSLAMADSNALKPGLWSAIGEGIWYSANGDKTPIPRTAADQCISTQTADDLLTKLPADQKDCSVEVLARNESRMVTRTSCPNGTIAHHTMTWTPTSYEIESYIKMSSQGHSVTSDLVTTGKYVGPCKDGASPEPSNSD